MDTWELPAHWEWQSLRSLVEIKYGRGLPKGDRSGGNILVFGANGEVGRHDVALTLGATIIIGRKGSVGAVNFSDSPCWAIDTTYYIDSTPPELDIKYLYYYLSILPLDSLDRSAAIPGVNRNELYTIQVPIPYKADTHRSLQAQRNIVKRIEFLLDELQNLQQQDQYITSNIESLIDSVLFNAFENVQKENQPKSLRNYQPFVTSGSRFWSSYASKRNQGPYFIRVGNVGISELIFDDLERLTLPENAGEARSMVQTNDILVTITGSVGRCCVVPAGLGTAYVSQHVALVRLPNDSSILPRYLMWYILSPFGGGQATKMAYGQSRPGLNLTQVRQLQLPIPSQNIQAQLVEYFDHVYDEIKALRASQTKDAQLLDQLPKAILAQAFRGGL